MAGRRKSMGAADFMAELQNDPEWVEQDRQRKAKHKARIDQLQAELAPEEAPLVADLTAVGCQFSEVWDMVNTSASYPEAVPVLLKHLPLVTHRVLRQGIGRALAVLEAEGMAGPTILQELRREQDPETRWVFANTLTIVADRSDAEPIRTLVEDPAYADVHERLNQALKNVT